MADDKLILDDFAVADPGFPRGGGANSPGGAPTYDFAKFHQKLHEIERIWTPRGGARPKFYYVDPPLFCIENISKRNDSIGHFDWRKKWECFSQISNKILDVHASNSLLNITV